MDKPLSRFDSVLRVLLDGVAGLAMTGIIIVVLVQVVSRLIGAPVSWTEEATRYLFVWMVFLGVGAGFRTVETARVTVFIDLLPDVLKRLSVLVYVSSSVLFFVLTAWTGWNLVRLQYLMSETSATLAIPMWAIGLIMPVAAILAILAVLVSVRTRRAFIQLPDLPLSAQTARADIVAPDTEQHP